MSTLKSNLIEPATGTTLTLGASGDTLTASSDSLQTNLYKDAGGNTLFQSDGSGTLSNVNSDLQGAGLKLITTNTVSSAVSTIDFTSGISSSYSVYVFMILNVAPVSNDQYFQAAGNVGSGFGTSTNVTSGSYMAWMPETGSGPGMAYRASESVATYNGYFGIGGSVGNQAERSMSGIFWLYSPASTTSIKCWLASTNTKQGDSTALIQSVQTQGYMGTASACTGMSFRFGSGNVASGTIKMYGMV